MTPEEKRRAAAWLREYADGLEEITGAEMWFREIRDLAAKLEAEACWCHTCRPVTLADSRMVLCPDCGNKRCPKAKDHRNACTGSNAVGQPGSAYPAEAEAGE